MNTLMIKTKQYFLESYQELRRVVWPTRNQTINHTLIVILFSVGVAIFLGLLDILFSYGIQQLLLK